MIAWVESQSVAEIAVLVFGFCYVVAALVFAAAAAVAARPIANVLKASSPTMLTPLSVIAGLLIAFLAARVWGNLDRAHAIIAQEASEIREAILLATALPDDTKMALRGGLRTYLRFVEAEDFPAMSENRASLHQPPGLAEAMGSLLVFVPANLGEQLIRERVVAALEHAMEARRNRVLLSRTAIAPMQWFVILVLDVLILLTIAMIHVDRLATVAANLFLFSTAIAACLVLLMVNDRPFVSGGYTVQPHALLEIGVE